MESSHNPASTRLPYFLSLPSIVRQQIYRKSGLIYDRNIDLNQQPNAMCWPSSAGFSVSYSLLLTCRTLYMETSYLLYTTNRFFIRYRDTHSLRRLKNLTADSISLLTQLTIHLNVASCEQRQPCCETYPGKPSICLEHDTALRGSSQAIISEWQTTARHIIAHIKPSCLRLYFVCDVDAFETAMLVVEPLRNIPTILDCGIRLARQPNPLIYDLAHDVARRATGNQVRSNDTGSAFRLLDLPRELRLQILQYTDLVTPLCEVEWSPENHFYLHYSTLNCGGISMGDFLECPPYAHYACQFRNCWQYEPTSVGCFCRRYHAAFASKCHCWSPPTSLFLVCKALQEEAQVVFFTRNRFIVVPSAGCTCPTETTPDRLEVSIFLTEVVPSQALHLLRDLELVFPPFHDDYLRPHEPAYQDWIHTVEHMSMLLNLPLLTLRVYMADVPSEPRSDFRSKMTKEQGIKIIKMYSRTLSPLVKLRENGLNLFFADLAWPFSHTRSSLRNPTSVLEQTIYLQKRIEKNIMGDDYDRDLLQLKNNRRSQWWEQSVADPYL